MTIRFAACPLALLVPLLVAGCASHKLQPPPPCLNASQARSVGAIDRRNAPPPCPAGVAEPAPR